MIMAKISPDNPATNFVPNSDILNNKSNISLLYSTIEKCQTHSIVEKICIKLHKYN